MESKIRFVVRRLILPTKQGFVVYWHWNTKGGRPFAQMKIAWIRWDFRYAAALVIPWKGS